MSLNIKKIMLLTFLNRPLYALTSSQPRVGCWKVESSNVRLVVRRTTAPNDRQLRSTKFKYRTEYVLMPFMLECSV
jgi:hypothetical protein